MLNYSKEEVEAMCAQARKDIKNPKMHALFYLHAAWGQKPEEKGAEEEAPVEGTGAGAGPAGSS